jgi:preprotein translocase subunit SecG
MLIFILIYYFTYNRNLKKISFWLGILLLIMSLFAIISSNKQKNEIVKQNTAIIFSPSITVKSSPDNSGTDLFLVHEGTKVFIEDKIGEWVEIILNLFNLSIQKKSKNKIQ